MYDEESRKNRIGAAGDQSDDRIMVSVSCITFDHGRYLRQALEGFLGQKTDFRYEVLIHDDASTDDTVSIIREYAERFPDIIRPMYEEENQYSKGISNISGVFNFPRARGKYIAMCEGDDYWSDPLKLQKQVDYMEAHPECSLCAHAAGIVSDDGAFRSETAIRPFTESRVLKPEEVISKKTNLPTASLLFRTRYANILPQWYFDCPVGDIPLQLFMLMNGSVYYMDEVMSMYRMGRTGSWGEMMDREALEKAALRWEKHYQAMERLYGCFDADTEGRWHDAVEDALKRQRFHIDLKEGCTKAALDPGNRKYLEELPKAEAKLLKLKARAPYAYTALQSIYHLVRGGR